MPVDQIPISQVNQDTDAHSLPKGHVRDLLNCYLRSSTTDQEMAVESAPGNTLRPYVPMPAGANKVVGQFEDKVTESVIYFVHNENTDHLILQYFPATDQVQKVAQGSFLDLLATDTITGGALINDLLIWVNRIPRKLNVKWSRESENRQFHLYFQSGQTADYSLKITSQTGSIIVDQIIHSDATNANFREVAKSISDAVNLLAPAPVVFESAHNSEYVSISFNAPGAFQVEFTQSAGFAVAVLQNQYAAPNITNTALINVPPFFPPSTALASLPNDNRRRDIAGKPFQWRMRYVYADNTRSTLGPASILEDIAQTALLPVIVVTSNINSYILVYANDELRDPDFLNIIKRVDFFVRESFISDWTFYGSKDRATMVKEDYQFEFDNLGSYPAISTEEATAPFDSIPREASAAEFMNNRLFLADLLEGYEPPEFVDLAFSLDVDFQVSGFGTTGYLAFKRPGQYRLGIVYYDEYNRQSSVISPNNADIYIPGYHEDLADFDYVNQTSPSRRRGIAHIRWEIYHRPPIWAKRYAWVRTQDAIHSTFIFGNSTEVKYFEQDLTTETTASSSRAAFVGIKFDEWRDPTKVHNNKFYTWTYSEGDRIRLHFNGGTGQWVEELIEADLHSQVGDTYFVKNIGIPQFFTNSTFEIYAPKKAPESPFFYEVGEFYEIGNPGADTRYHKGHLQDQSTDLSLPATGRLSDGEMWKITFTRGTDIIHFDSPSQLPERQDSVESGSLGRPTVMSDEVGEAQNGNLIRWSNTWISNTNINGLSTFQSSNAHSLNVRFGDILRLKKLGDQMLALATADAIRLFVQERIITDAGGTTSLGLTSEIIGDDQVVAGSYGTSFPESLTVQEQTAFWFSSQKNMVIRYSGGQPEPISDLYMKRTLRDRGNLHKQYGGTIWTSFDTEHDQLIVSFSGLESESTVLPEQPITTVATALTIAFQNKGSAWAGSWSYAPEAIGKAGTKLVSFHAGELYLHGSNPIHGEFYGTKYPAQVTAICNAAPGRDKVFVAIAQHSNVPWATTFASSTGQRSHLILSDFRAISGIHYTGMLKDENTPGVDNPLTQGDDLRGTTLQITLESNQDEVSTLRLIEIEFTNSFPTLT